MSDGPPFAASLSAPRPAPAGDVSCYICLGRIPWAAQAPMRYDRESADYVRVETPPGGSAEARQHALANAMIRCPVTSDPDETHYLPYAYGLHGRPVVIGFIGAASTGKTHLLSAMIQAVADGGLARHGVTAHPVDAVVHEEFMTREVETLFGRRDALDGTEERVVQFADAFVMSDGGPARVVAFFDVSGEELSSAGEAKQFLYIADALIFVADPERFATRAGRAIRDGAVANAMNVLGSARRLDAVAAAVVLNKADLVRHDDPVATWLREDDDLDPERSLRESEDVYAYLHARGAQAWTRPYQECARATLHVATATGTAKSDNRFLRGVRPRRVLGPLLAVLAMTGVVTTPAARSVGV